MTYLDTILRSKNTTKAIPFWKLHINDEELNNLIEYIRNILNEIQFDNMTTSEKKKAYLLFDREACLMYALWWNKNYDGGRDKWHGPFEDFNIDNNYFDFVQAAVLNELRTNTRLKIPIFRGEHNNEFIGSLLAQGGLPMNVMRNNDNNTTSFENFLYHLISEYEGIDRTDWLNIQNINIIADRYLNNRALRQCDAVKEFAMEIAKAYLDNNTEFADYEELNNIINHIRERRGNARNQEHNYFKVIWKFRINGNKLGLYYSLSIPNEINKETQSNIITYYLNENFVGSYYHQRDNRFSLMPGAANSRETEWKQQNGIVLKRKIDDTIDIVNTLINCEPPYMEEPLIIQRKKDYWIPNQSANNDDCYDCLIPQNWECTELSPSNENEFKFNDSIYYLVNLNWDEIPDKQLHFNERTTGEEKILDNRISDYSVSFSPMLPSRIEESHSAIAVNIPDVRTCFTFYKDNQSCERGRFNFYYKSTENIEYMRYTGGNLPLGPIVMKVCYPDGLSKTFSFYNIIGLDVSIDNNTLEISFEKGTCSLLNNQNIRNLGEGKYQVVHADNTNGFAPIIFRICPQGVTKTIDIGFTSPLQQSCFIDSQGNILNQGTPIAVNELFNYKMNLSEGKEIIISYMKKNDENNGERCLIRKRIRMNSGRYSLDFFKDDIERFFCINGFNDYHKYISIKINEANSVHIRRNAFIAQECKNEDGINGIYVTRNGKPASQLILHAIAINAGGDSPLFHKDDIIMVENGDTGKYFMPELEDSEIKEFVIFSDNNMSNENMLPSFLNIERDLSKEERDANKTESIKQIHDALSDGDEYEWNNTWFYFNLVIEYRLNFNTFNTFLAIANDPFLIASFILRIQAGFDKNTIIEELQRMENELSFGFHYIPSKCWQKEYERLRIPCDVIPEEFNFLEELLKRQFGEDNQYLKPMMFKLLGNPWPNHPDYSLRYQDYLENVNDALSVFEILETPDNIPFARVDYHPISWRNYYTPIEKLQYLAIVLPQSAAQYVFGADMDLWSYQEDNKSNEFIRRMINYMRRYASETYNNLFITALMKEPVIQNNNN